MEILQPTSWREALEQRAAHPGAKPLAGGTDVMVELNFDHIRPPQFASDAEVELASLAGTRRVPIADFVTGPKRNCLRADELIAAFWVRPADGPQQFAKIGTRNAMVIAVCSLGLAISRERRSVAACIGSAGPTPVRARAAGRFLAGG